MPGECYLGTIQQLNLLHQDFIVDLFGKAQHRIFVDAYDIPQKPANESWPYFISRVWANMPEGIRFWKNDEGQDHIYVGSPGEGSTLNSLKMCKFTGAIPIICIGHSDEKSSWLSPHNNNLLNHLDFLEEFCKYTAIWLREKMGFIQAHLEIWNEPAEKMYSPTYAKVVIAMARGFIQYPNFKIHFGSNDINIDVNSYLPMLLKNKEFISLMRGQYYSTHELWARQHGQGYIGKMVKLLEGTGIELSVTECSPTGDWGQYGVNNDYGNLFNDLIKYKIKIWCGLFMVRCEFFGDVFDELRVFTKEARTIDNKYYKSGDWLPNGYAQKKHLALRDFCQKYYYKQIPVEDENFDMKLEEYYYKKKVTFNRDTKKAGIKFIQSVVGVTPDGNWGDFTEMAVEKYQEVNRLQIDGIVGPLTFRDMMKTNPDAYIDLQYYTATGRW